MMMALMFAITVMVAGNRSIRVAQNNSQPPIRRREHEAGRHECTQTQQGQNDPGAGASCAFQLSSSGSRVHNDNTLPVGRLSRK